MKLMYFDDFRLGALTDDGTGVVDIGGAVKGETSTGATDPMSRLIENYADCRDAVEAAMTSGTTRSLNEVRIRPPVTQPCNIVCMAVNYMEDGTRDAPAPINAFQKTRASLIGHGDTMHLPDMPAAIFEGEAELALVIGRRARNVSEEHALSHVFGYMNFIDGSARGVPAFYQMKAREGFAPIGPYLVTSDEITNPQNLQVRLSNNGEVRQDFNTDDMAHSIARSIAWVSSIHTLEPGDILATGTNHRGLHAFMDGDAIDLEIEGLGRLSFTVSDPLKREWPRHSRSEHEVMGLEGRHATQSAGKYTPD